MTMTGIVPNPYVPYLLGLPFLLQYCSKQGHEREVMVVVLLV